MNLADALKKLYTKLGGTDALPQGTNNCTLVDKIADEVSGGGSSGGGTLIVTETWSADGKSATLDKTYNQIKSAVDSGQVALLKQFETGIMSSEVTKFGYLASLTTRSDGVTVGFAVGGITNEYVSTSADGVLKKDGIK